MLHSLSHFRILVCLALIARLLYCNTVLLVPVLHFLRRANLGRYARDRKSAICISVLFWQPTSRSYFWSLIIIPWRGRTCKGLPEDSFNRLVITIDCDVPPERKLVEFLQCVNNSAHFLLYLGVSRLGMGESTAGVCHWFPTEPFWLASHWIARGLDGLQ